MFCEESSDKEKFCKVLFGGYRLFIREILENLSIALGFSKKGGIKTMD